MLNGTAGAMARVFIWPARVAARIALWLLGVAFALATLGALVTQGVSWEPLLTAALAGLAWEARRAVR